MKNSRRLENLHHLAKSSLVSGTHTKFDVYSIKEDNETVIFQRFKLTHWLRGHPSNLMGENFKSAVSNSFYCQLYSILSSEGMYVRLCVWVYDLEKNSNWLPLITKKLSLCFCALCPLSLQKCCGTVQQTMLRDTWCSSSLLLPSPSQSEEAAKVRD